MIRESDIAKLPVEQQEQAKLLLDVLLRIVEGNKPEEIRRPQDIYQLSLDLGQKIRSTSWCIF